MHAAVPAAVHELGYAPDSIAQKPSQGRSFPSGIHTFPPSFSINSNDSYYLSLGGVEQEAVPQGYNTSSSPVLTEIRRATHGSNGFDLPTNWCWWVDSLAPMTSSCYCETVSAFSASEGTTSSIPRPPK